MASSDWAAWVQAVGSIGAIYAAARIASSQRKHELDTRTRDELLAARDVAIQLAPSMLKWSRRAKKWADGIDIPGGTGEWVVIMNIAEDPDSLALPRPVEAMTGNFRVLGPAAGNLQRAVVAIAIVADRRRDFADAVTARNQGSEEGVRKKDELLDLVRNASREIQAAADAVVRLRDR